jgi:hypothetical protein
MFASEYNNEQSALRLLIIRMGFKVYRVQRRKTQMSSLGPPDPFV